MSARSVPAPGAGGRLRSGPDRWRHVGLSTAATADQPRRRRGSPPHRRYQGSRVGRHERSEPTRLGCRPDGRQARCDASVGSTGCRSRPRPHPRVVALMRHSLPPAVRLPAPVAHYPSAPRRGTEKTRANRTSASAWRGPRAAARDGNRDSVPEAVRRSGCSQLPNRTSVRRLVSRPGNSTPDEMVVCTLPRSPPQITRRSVSERDILPGPGSKRPPLRDSLSRPP